MKARSASAWWTVSVALLALAIVAVLGGLAVLNPAQDPAGNDGKDRLLDGLWLSPRGNHFPVRGNTLHLAARAYSTTRGNPLIDYVNFTGTWSGDTWHVLCSTSDPVSGTADLYECHVDYLLLASPRQES
jgi:hypothetical protein